MTKMNSKLSKLVCKLCTLLLALLGFSCTSEELADMYGTPTGEYEIKGKVTTEEGRDVKGAIIRATRVDLPSNPLYIKADTTDVSGQYEVKYADHPFKKIKVVCIPQDNSLEADSVITEVNFIKDGKSESMWYYGHAEATVNFVLKKKQDME